MSDDYLTDEKTLANKLHFEPSTIETIDRAMLNYIRNLNLFVDSNKGWRKVPVLWGTAERSFQVKDNKDIRDSQGMLVMPIITVARTSMTKDMTSKGVFQGNVPGISDEKGGSLPVSRVIYQEKTTAFANADAYRLHLQDNYPRPNPKVVYRTVTVPMPVNVTVMYDITIRTEYQQQMNDLVLPFVTRPGTINYQRLFEGEHRYEAFIQENFQTSDNVGDFSSEERKFETKITVKVVGYLVGEEGNAVKPHYSIRENAVEVKIPRERVSLSEVPEHEFGSYYGLAGVPSSITAKQKFFPYFFSNVPAVGSGGSTTVVSSGGGSSTPSEPTEPGDYVTADNFATYLSQNLIVREMLKENDDPTPTPANQLTISSLPKENTEQVFVNGLIMALGADYDYTISGRLITFTFDLQDTDSVYVTYIKN